MSVAPRTAWPDPIPVAEALPPADPETTWRILPDWESKEVLAWSPGRGCGNWHTATYRYEEDFGSSWYTRDYGELDGVTHWLPFPPPPKELPRYGDLNPIDGVVAWTSLPRPPQQKGA